MLILASQSPRRKDLLMQKGISFKVIPSDFDESKVQLTTPQSYVLTLAKEKTYEVYRKNPQDVILGADTIVVFDNQVLGKPKDRHHAFEILNQLNGKKHHVYTAVCIKHHTLEEAFMSYAEVTFHNVSEKDLWDYIDTNEPMDKAGAYGIQGLGSFLVQSYYGNYHAIMGLPIDDVLDRLKQFQSYL